MIKRLLALAAVVTIFSMTFIGAAESAPEGLIITATASGSTWEYNDPDSPIPATPSAEMHEAYSLASFDSGPSSHGLSSVFWPGSAGANFGPVYGLPAYPVRAETFYPKGPEKNAMEPGPPGLSMKAEATEEFASATASTGAEDGSPGAAARRLVSSVTSSVADENGVSEATATVKDLNIGDGAITIESVVTKARITTDGKKATVTGKTTVTGVMVADQFEASIDEKGLHINDQVVEIPDVFGEGPAKEALDQLGISVKVARPITKIKGGSALTELGGLVVKFDALALVPYIEPLPDEIEDEIYKNVDMRKETVYRFGSVSLGVDASDAGFELPELPPVDPPAPAPPADLSVGGGGAPAVGIPGVGGGDVPSFDAAPEAAPQEQPTLAAEPASITAHPLPASILVLTLLAAIGSTRVMRKMADQLVGGSAMACPHKDVG
ncbi:MAG TPA: choice-of-anchor P family protein [Actinomycetota bacterium]|nr:choice-of-anchor P family protein [Actinomycetota bacterium]